MPPFIVLGQIDNCSKFPVYYSAFFDQIVMDVSYPTNSHSFPRVQNFAATANPFGFRRRFAAEPSIWPFRLIMYITVTYLKLRSPLQVFRMAKYVGKIQQQSKLSPGFIHMATTGWWKLWFTLSAWKSEAELKQFARSGEHLEAMKISAQISPELSTYTFEAAQIPDWKEAKRLLAAHGRVQKLPKPATSATKR